MKKVKYLLLVFMALVVLTGCSINVNNDAKDKDEKTNTEEKDNKVEDKKDNKKDNKDDIEIEEGIVSFDKVEDAIDQIEDKSDDTLVCDMEALGQAFEMTVGFKNDEISTMGVEMVMDLSSYGVTKENFSEIESLDSASLLEAMGLDSNAKGVMVALKTDKEALTITIKIVIDLKNADPEVVELFNLDFDDDDLKISYKDLKEEAIAQGYNCK